MQDLGGLFDDFDRLAGVHQGLGLAEAVDRLLVAWEVADASLNTVTLVITDEVGLTDTCQSTFSIESSEMV